MLASLPTSTVLWRAVFEVLYFRCNVLYFVVVCVCTCVCVLRHSFFVCCGCVSEDDDHQTNPKYRMLLLRILNERGSFTATSDISDLSPICLRSERCSTPSRKSPDQDDFPDSADHRSPHSSRAFLFSFTYQNIYTPRSGLEPEHLGVCYI